MKGKIRYVVPIGSTLIGVFIAIYTLANYELFKPAQGPGPGLLPFALSVLLALIGVIDFFKKRKAPEPELKKDNWLIVLCVGLILALSYVIGMIPCVLIFAFWWIKIKEKCSWLTTIITMAIIFILAVPVFQIWMDVPYPTGIIYEMLVG